MPHQTQALLIGEFSWLLHFYSAFGQEMWCTASLHCLLSYSNMQDMKLMWLIQYLLLLFTCDRKSKSHMGKLNHLSCWCNAYLVIDLHKRDLSINTQCWEKWWFYFLRPEKCHQPSGATQLLPNKPIAESVIWLHIPFVCIWIYLLAQFYYYLISTLQNWPLDSIPFCLLLDDSFPQSLFQHPILLNVSMNTQVNSEEQVTSSCHLCSMRTQKGKTTANEEVRQK